MPSSYIKCKVLFSYICVCVYIYKLKSLNIEIIIYVYVICEYIYNIYTHTIYIFHIPFLFFMDTINIFCKTNNFLDAIKSFERVHHGLACLILGHMSSTPPRIITSFSASVTFPASWIKHYIIHPIILPLCLTFLFASQLYLTIIIYNFALSF